MQPTAERESIFAGSESGGTSGDPKKEISSVAIIYWNERAGPRVADFYEILAAGGYKILSIYWPPGQVVPWTDADPDQSHVVVRGRPARMIELRRTQNANVDWRAVRWEQQVNNGGVVQFEVSNHPDRYSVEQTLEFIEALEEVR